MVNIRLERFSYSETDTEGRLYVGEHVLRTLERPWIPSQLGPGGKPFESCVPEGVYEVRPYIKGREGSHQEKCYIISNEELGVFMYKSDREDFVGRYSILFHKGNWVTDVVGCILVGLSRTCTLNNATRAFERSVSESFNAMRIMNDQLGRDKVHTLEIVHVGGTS